MAVRSARGGLAAGALLVAIAVAACSGGTRPGGSEPANSPTPARPPARGGTIRAALPGDVDAWNPYVSEDASSANVLELVYPHLVREASFDGRESSFEPWLALSWEFSPDRLTLTFVLRPDAAWSDGTPVTCRDVKFTFDSQRSDDLAWAGASLKDRIKGVDCPDDRTAVFRFREAYADQLVDANDDEIVPAAYASVPLREWGGTDWTKHLVTCGPFRVVKVTPGQEAILERDPRWWGASGVIPDRVAFRVYPDAGASFSAFLEGEVDVLPKVPSRRAAEVAARPGLRTVRVPSFSYAFLAWNMLEPGAYRRDRRARGCRPGPACPESTEDILRLRRAYPHPFLADARVRGALTLGVDRDDLVRGMLGGQAKIAASPIPSSSWAHDSAAGLAFDPAAAAAALREAGFSMGSGGVLERGGRKFELRVLVNAENAGRRDVLDRIASGLASVGIRVIPVPVPRAEFVERARDKDFDAVLWSWRTGTRVEPQSFLHTRAAVSRGNNLGSWSTPESDALLDRAASARSQDEAGPLWKEWQAIFRVEQPYTLLYEEDTLMGLGARVRDATPSPLNPFEDLQGWWLAPASQASR